MSNAVAGSGVDLRRAIGVSGRIHPGRRWLLRVISVVAVALIAAVVFTRVSEGSSGTPEYALRAVTRGDLVVSVTATGNLEPTNSIDIGIEVSGTIERVEVDYNDRVSQGQVLARLDTTKLEAQVLRSRAALASANASVEQARATLNESVARRDRLLRVHTLSGGSVPSQSELESAEAAVHRARADEASAVASVAQASATLESDETDLSKAVVHAPIRGVVLTRYVDTGQTVVATLQAPVLFTIAEDLTQMELHVDIDEADVGMVRQGQEASFTVDAYPDRIFRAKLKQVRFGAKQTEGVTSYVAVLAVDNSDLSLRPGMTATADITVRRAGDVLLIPSAALRFSPPEEQTPQRGLLGSLLPRPPQSERRPAMDNEGPRRVWALRDGSPIAIAVDIGDSDGLVTEVLGGEIREGMELVVAAMEGR